MGHKQRFVAGNAAKYGQRMRRFRYSSMNISADVLDLPRAGESARFALK